MEEIVDIDLDGRGNPMTPKNDKIALVDADTVAFTACLSAEEEIMLLPESFYTPEEWQDIISDPTYNEESGMMYTIDLDQAMTRAEGKLQKILDSTGCSELELHFTGKKCFRYDIYPDYKANRKGKRSPVGLQPLKEMLTRKYPGAIHDKFEADDIVVCEAMKHPDKYIMVAIDKDVIHSVPGRHFNYYESSFYNKDMKWVEVTEAQARMWPYLQSILGDNSDNIIGPHGIGPKKALKFISESMTEEELWKGTVNAFISKGMTAEDALLNINLVHMHLLVDGEIVLMEVIDGRIQQRVSESN